MWYYDKKNDVVIIWLLIAMSVLQLVKFELTTLSSHTDIILCLDTTEKLVTSWTLKI